MSVLQLGLKLWSSNQNYYEEAKRLVAGGFCDYIELYTCPDTLDEFGSLWKSIDVPYIIHAPHYRHGMNLAKAECQSANDQLAAEAFAFADLLQAKHVIFHPGIDGDDEETVRQLNVWPEERKKRILIENKPYRTINESPLVCNGHLPAAIRRIRDETGVGFCFDIAHGICSANSRQVDTFEDLTAYEALQPAMYHLSDNDSTSEIDDHKHLGDGDYDFARIFRLIDTTKPISVETDKEDAHLLKDFENDVRFLRKKHYEFRISPATLDDMLGVYELANEPSVRANSISTDPIPWETHRNWYQKKIVDTDVRFYLVRNAVNKVCGYVRYDFNSEESKWYVSIAFFPQYRGHGLGTWAMERTEMWLRQTSNHPLIYLAKTGNIASINTAQRTGYSKAGQDRGGGWERWEKCYDPFGKQHLDE